MLSFVFEGGSWWIALKQLSGSKMNPGYYKAMRRSKDPSSFMAPFEDSAALTGILIAAIGTFASVMLEMPVLGGISSLLIGLVLAATSALLARESKSSSLESKPIPGWHPPFSASPPRSNRSLGQRAFYG